MSRAIFPRRRARHVSLTDDEHRKWIDLGGSAYLRACIERDWSQLAAKDQWEPVNEGILDRVWRKAE